MKIHGILFSAPMALANIRHLKGQTRRLVKNRDILANHPDPNGTFTGDEFGTSSPQDLCKFQPGDTLYQKETFFRVGKYKDAPIFHDKPETLYRADPDTFIGCHKWTPSIFMPPEASRFTATVTTVRVQRLDEISHEDAEAEGVVPIIETGDLPAWQSTAPPDTKQVISSDSITPYRTLWNSIHLPPSPVYGPRDKATRRRPITHYISHPWCHEDFENLYPLTAGRGTTPEHRGKPILILPNPWVWAISYQPLPRN